MKYIKIYENINNISVKVLTADELSKLYQQIYPKGNDLKDKIHYFDWNDMNTYFANKKFIDSLRLITAYNKKDILGICKIAYWDMDKHYAMSYLSVNNDYFNQGISKLLLDKLFIYFSKTYPKETLFFSGYSIDGWKYLHNKIIDLSKKYDIRIEEKPIEYVTDWSDDNRTLFQKSRQEINKMYGKEYYEF